VVLAATRSTLGDMRVAVVGLGTLVGKPIATWLMGKAKGVWLLGRASDASVLKDADVVVLGAGRPGIVTPTMLKEGALVVDFGYSKAPQAPSRMDADQSAPACRQAGMNAESTKSHIFGDFDPAGSEEKNISYTPTPGGTGPILVAKLFENFYVLNADKRG
jgi:methylenetetrahydrofolate dehydrogenase (NADP+)/methenyltetrahydrofolate cyclohydrolase